MILVPEKMTAIIIEKHPNTECWVLTKLYRLGKESTCNPGDPGSISELGRSPGEGNSKPLQYSCLGNPWTEESGCL